MKTYKILLLFVIAILGLSGCHDNDDTPVLSNVQSSILDELPFQDIVLTKPKTNPLLCTITWTETQLYLDGSGNATPSGPVNYTLEIDTVGANFSTAQPLAVTSTLNADILTADINKLLISKLGGMPGRPKDVEIRVVSRYGENSVTPIVSGNTLYLTITPYQDSNLLQPIYIIGDMNGWNNTNTDFLMFRDDSDPENPVIVYTGKVGGYFKFCPAESLGSMKMYCNAGDGKLTYEDRSDGAFYVEGTAYKTIKLNLSDMTWTMEDYNVSAAKNFEMINFIGAFCNWGENNSDPAMTRSAYDSHMWSMTIDLSTVQYGVKFRASHSWDNRWCPPDPNTVPYGITAYNPEGQDNNISLTSTGKYYIKFNDLTGHYVFLLQE